MQCVQAADRVLLHQADRAAELTLAAFDAESDESRAYAAQVQNDGCNAPCTNTVRVSPVSVRALRHERSMKRTCVSVCN